MLPKNESSQRISRLKTRLTEQGLDGALFIYPVDVLYFTGTRQNAALWVPVAGEPMLLVRKSFERARKESAVADVRPFPPSRELSSLFDGEVQTNRPYLRCFADAALCVLLGFPDRQGVC